MADEDYVVVEDVDAVRVVRLHNPARHNAWNLEMETQYFDVLADSDVDESVRVILVTGTGRSFCPGVDMQRLEDAARDGDAGIAGRRPQTHVLTLRKPTIAAINGSCAGVGFVQALACDVRFAAASAKFSTAYSRRGLPAEYGTSWLLPRLIGYGRALELLLSGRTFGADEARELGLVSRVVPDDELFEIALAYATDLARNCSPASMMAIRRQVYGDLGRTFPEAMSHTLALTQAFVGSADFTEGVASFLERRSPRFAPLPVDARHPTDHDYRL